MYVNWVKCGGGDWCGLNTVDLDSGYFQTEPEGVYIVWHGGQKPHTVYVGQGKIKARIQDHRSNAEIQSYRSLGLSVTWAVIVSPTVRDGVEKYLADLLAPKVGTYHPAVAHIVVNLPLW